MEELRVITHKRWEIIDLTEEINSLIKKKKFLNGLLLIFVPHTTCALFLMENESHLKDDFFNFFKKLIKDFDFSHNLIDSNGDSHLISSLLGQEKILIVKNQSLVLGPWQSLCLLELDGPRERRIYLEFLEKE